MKTLEEGFNFLLQYFKGDYEKVLMWLYIPNPSLGNVSALHMIMHGRTDKLLQFLDSAKEGNFT